MCIADLIATSKFHKILIMTKELLIHKFFNQEYIGYSDKIQSFMINEIEQYFLQIVTYSISVLGQEAMYSGTLPEEDKVLI